MLDIRSFGEPFIRLPCLRTQMVMNGDVGDVRLFIVRLLGARVAQSLRAMHAIKPRTVIIPVSDDLGMTRATKASMDL